MIDFVCQYSVKIENISTATLVEEVKPEKRWVWTLKFNNKNRIWAFLDYPDSNATPS